MHRQSFIFNPMSGGSNMPSLHTRQQNEESASKDFGPIGGGLRNHRQQMQSTKNSEPLVLPLSTKQRQFSEGQKENKLAMNGDRLASLHSKLHLEAEKIKQWKINTEMQLKDKDRKMIEATKTIDSLRKSILELQFLNESVSSKLHDEKSQKEETVQKITTTRNMCNALKEHLVKLERNVTSGENMLDVQKYENQQKNENFQELVLKFQELEIKANTKEHEMKKEILNGQNARKEETDYLKSKVLEGEEYVKVVQENIEKYENEIKKMNDHLDLTNQELKSAKDNQLGLQEKLEEANSKLIAYEETLEEVKSAKNILTEETQAMKESYEQKVEAILNECDSLRKEIESRQNYLISKDAELQQKNQEITNLTESVGMKNLETEQIQIQVNNLCQQHLDFEAAAERLRNETEDLKMLIKEKESLLGMQEQKEEENTALLESEKEMTGNLKQDIALLQTEIQNASERARNAELCEAKVTELEIDNRNLVNQTEVLMSEIEKGKAQLEELQQENSQFCEHGKAIEKEIGELKAEKEQNEKEIEGLRLQIDQRCTDLQHAKEKLEELDAEIKEMRAERDEQADTIQQQVGSREKQIESAENRVKTIQAKLDAKAKQMIRFQADVKTLKAQSKIQQKENKKLAYDFTTAKGKIEELETENTNISENANQTSMNTMQNMELLSTTAESLKNEKEELLKNLERFGQEAEVSRQQSENGKQELDHAKHSFDAQISEMCKTLEKYKMENEKLMNVKEKEMDKQAKEMKNNKSISEKHLKEKQIEINGYKKNLEEKERIINELTNDVENTTQQVSDLQSKLESSANKVDEEMREVEVPRTPRTPRTPQMGTPSTPQVLLRTPQSILRASEEKPARVKHVAFRIADQEDTSDDEDILVRRKQSPSVVNKSPSVVSNVSMKSKVNSVRPTVRASPKLSGSTAAPSTPKQVTQILESPGKRLKRITPEKKELELDTFQQLFPEFDDSKKKKDQTKSKEMNKKSPFRSKMKKVIPRAKRDTKTTKMDTSWFDSDSAFGFGMEE